MPGPVTEALWEQALSFLTGELGATRAVVLHEDDPDRDFEVIAGRGIDAQSFWRDANIDFSVLSSVCSSGLPENRRNHLLCAPGRDRNGRVVALLYADRPRLPFSAQSLTSLSDFARTFEERLQGFHVTRVKTRSRSLSRVGTANTRVAFLLAEQGLLTADEAEQYLQQSKTQGVILEKLLVDSGRLREEEILFAQARYYGLEAWVANPEGVNAEITRLLPLDKARELGAMPIGLSGDQLGVALALPDNTIALEELRRMSGRNVVVRLVGRLGFQRIVDSLKAEEPVTMVSTGNLLAGRYRVDELPLLVCRFSSLLNAVDVETNQPVVLRRLEPPTKDKAQARAQTLSEGRRMSQLRHPNLPFVERVIESEEQIYLVLESFTGPTLEQLVIQHGPVPAQQLPLLADQLMSVFEYLHTLEPPIIHRDLRPEVVILTPDAQVKLAEFGLAKMHADATNDATSFRAHGSPFYASPEQLLGEPSHPRQDLYSLGAILYYLASGNTPGKSLERCFNQTAPGKVAGLPVGFPGALETLISRLLEPDGELRPQSMAEARKLLEPALPPPLPAPRARGRIQLEQLPARPSDPGGPQAPESFRPDPAFATPEPAVSVGPESSATASEPTAVASAGPLGEPTQPYSPSAQPSASATGFDGLGEPFHPEQAPASLWAEPGAASEPAPSAAADNGFDPYAPAPATHQPPAQQAFEPSPSAGAGAGNGGFDPYSEPFGEASPLESPSAAATFDPYAVHEPFQPEPVASGEPSASVWEEPTASPPASAWGDPAPPTREPEAPTPRLEHATSWIDAIPGETLVVSPQAVPVVPTGTLEGVLRDALSVGALALHWDPGQPLRARVDGRLQATTVSPEAGLAELRALAPEGGRVQVHGVELWVSLLGDSVVARVSQPQLAMRTLTDLGMPASIQERLRALLDHGPGVLVATGPGRLATLYACLAERQAPDRRLLTVERLPELRLVGVQTVLVRPGYSTEQAVEDALAHDPDVLLVAQVSTSEAARSITQAALAGCLTLVGMGATDSVAAVPLAGDPGVLLGCLAQRMTRRLCDCREEVPVTAEVQASFERYRVASPRVFAPRGCPLCQGGYRGEIGLFELLVVSPEIRGLLARGTTPDEIRRGAFTQGFQPLLQDGLQKVAAGLTSLDELHRVCR